MIKKINILISMALCGLLFACQPSPTLLQKLPTPLFQLPSPYTIRGIVKFPPTYTTQVAAPTIIQQATVSILQKDGTSLATGLTDAGGKFEITAANFSPQLGEIYLLEAYKGLNNSLAGNSQARLRTFIRWTSDGWDSLSGFAKIVISPATTSITIIQDLLDLPPENMLSSGNTPTILPDTDDFNSGSTGIQLADYERVLFLVNKILDRDNDPITHVVYDPVGLFFFNTIIARPFLAGDVTTVAGGATHRDGLASEAMFLHPNDVILDASGQNLIINDAGNRVIRKYNLASQTVSTVAGLPYYRGFADGIGSAVRFYSATQIAAYNKNGINGVLIADYNNARIRLLDLATNQVTTLKSINYPHGVAYDGSRYIYVSSYNAHSIYQIDTDNGMSSLRIGGHWETYPPPQTGGYWASGATNGNGATNDSYFTYPMYMAMDQANKRLYIWDNNYRIRAIDTSDPNYPSSTVAGSSYGYAEGTGSAAQFRHIRGMTFAAADNALYVSDTYNHIIRKVQINPDGSGTTSFLSGNQTADYKSGAANTSMYNYPYGLAVQGNQLYVTDNYNHRLRVVDKNTGSSTPLMGDSFVDGIKNEARFQNIVGITGNAKDAIFITEQYSRTIRKLNPDTGEVTTLAGARESGFVDGSGNVARFNYPYRMAFDGVDSIFVGDFNNNAIRKVNIDTGFTSTIHKKQSEGATLADGPLLNTYFDQPRGLFFDEQDNILYVLERTRLRQIDFNSGTNAVTTITGEGGSNGNTTLALFSFNGNQHGLLSLGQGIFYFTEANRLRKIDITANSVTTVAGSNSSGYADGKPSLSFFDFLYDVVTDGSGTLFMSDFNNNRVRRYLISEQKVTSVAGGGSGIPSLDSKGPSARLDGPHALYFDDTQRILYVGEYSNHSAGEINYVLNPGNKLKRIE